MTKMQNPPPPSLNDPPKKPLTQPRPKTRAPKNQIQEVSPISLTMAEKKFEAPRIILTAVEGWGKTTFGAFSLQPAILMARGETGYKTLLGCGLVPELPIALVNDWQELLATLEDFIKQDELPFKTLVFDALNGFERLCHEHVCKTEFNGEWGDRGFGSYQKGYDVSVSSWQKLIQLLDKLHDKGIMIILLEHTKVTTYKNPMGPDFDKYIPACHEKTMAVTRRWADALLFGTFFTSVETRKDNNLEVLRKGKGVGDSSRILYTERRDAFDAKNRYNMPECIDVPDEASKVFNEIWDNINPNKKGINDA